jgi:hypothetical protein
MRRTRRRRRWCPEAVVAEARGLGVPRGARGVDVEEQVSGAQPFSRRWVGIPGPLVRERLREILRSCREPGLGGLGIRVDPDLEVLRHLARDRIQGRQALAPGHQDARARRAQRVIERAAGDVRVQQRGHGAELGEAHPGDEELGPVLHQQRDHVAASDPLACRPVRRAVRMGVQLRVAEPPLAEQDEGPAAVLGSPLLDPVGDRVGRVRLVAHEDAHAAGEARGGQELLEQHGGRLSEARASDPAVPSAARASPAPSPPRSPPRGRA